MRGSGLGLEVYADADYADKANSKRSVPGAAVTSGDTVVSLASPLTGMYYCKPREPMYRDAALNSQ